MKKFYVVICLTLAIISMGFITKPDSTRTELKKNIPLGKAKEIKTEIAFTVGELYINASSDQLSEGTYRFNIEKWRPEISYTEENQTGYLNIKTIDERTDRNYNDKDNSTWNLSLNKKVRNDLTIKILAGKGRIDLQDCNLKRLECSMAAGDININLRNTSVPDMIFKGGAGTADFDFSGKWNNDLNASIKGGVGDASLKLPSQTGVKITIHGFLGEKNTPGFRKENGSYTNAMYGKTKETLYIDVTGGIGNVTLKLVD